MRRGTTGVLVLGLLLYLTGGVAGSRAMQLPYPSGVPQKAGTALETAKKWRADAILVMVEANDWNRSGQFSLRFSFYSPADRTGLWLRWVDLAEKRSPKLGPLTGAHSRSLKEFLDLPTAVEQARKAGMTRQMDHAVLRVWQPQGLAWRVVPAYDPDLKVYDVAATLNRTASDTLLVPGKRVGPVSLGMSAADAVKVLGLA